MENVAEHINEMQRIHEEYGAIFDHLYRQYQRSTSQLHELNPGDLLYYGGVEWLNISGFLGKIKKGLELHAMCFVFRTAVVFLCKERLRQKKKSIMVRKFLTKTFNLSFYISTDLFLVRYHWKISWLGIFQDVLALLLQLVQLLLVQRLGEELLPFPPNSEHGTNLSSCTIAIESPLFHCVKGTAISMFSKKL